MTKETKNCHQQIGKTKKERKSKNQSNDFDLTMVGPRNMYTHGVYCK